ncbi:MAG: peptidyl-prolyl cis-trans isomerase [Proteobacteria bacterium]|nr:peptidyl-prolyl cis-trans isomerase [Pseudomonadota bacterium]MBU1640439.1 peptidyl-prolyl cis-trans isomerase [Pseudomonadota bacterium]
MHKLTWLVLWTLFFVGGISHDARAWFWDDASLVTIGGETFSAQDYRDWWRNWQEENMSLPESPDEFINWQLMAQEGTRMQLDSEPDYQRKVDTFLKVRSLMILKNEEVDAKATPTRAEMWAVYEKEYCPRWNIEVFFFETETQAAAKGKELAAGTISGDDLRALTVTDGGPLFSEAKWLRVPQIKEEWLASLNGQKPGYVTAPQAMGKHFMILYLVDEKGPEEEDFAHVMATIQSKVRDQLSADLTFKLVQDLKKKYKVNVDEEFLATIGETSLDLESSEKPVVTTTQGDISAGALQAMMAKERQFRKQYNFSPEDTQSLKERVVGSMLAQTLISWDAINRHYEEKEPFAAVYQFYRKHRLTKEIEKRFIQPKAKLDEAEAKAYYEENQEKFSHPEMISYVLAEGEEELINRMRQDVTQGEDFLEVAAKHFPGGLPVIQVPVSHLDAALKGPLLALNKGEVSMPFAMDHNFAMAKVVNRRPAMPVPFLQVKEEIDKKLSDEKFAASRKEFLDQLKKKSAIKVNNKTWSKLRKELEQQNESKENK